MQAARAVAAEENIREQVKRTLAVEGHEVTKAWAKVVEVVAEIGRVKLRASTGEQIGDEKCRDEEEAVFVWEQEVKMMPVVVSVRWREAEG